MIWFHGCINTNNTNLVLWAIFCFVLMNWKISVIFEFKIVNYVNLLQMHKWMVVRKLEYVK